MRPRAWTYTCMCRALHIRNACMPAPDTCQCNTNAAAFPRFPLLCALCGPLRQHLEVRIDRFLVSLNMRAYVVAIEVSRVPSIAVARAPTEPQHTPNWNMQTSPAAASAAAKAWSSRVHCPTLAWLVNLGIAMAMHVPWQKRNLNRGILAGPRRSVRERKVPQHLQHAVRPEHAPTSSKGDGTGAATATPELLRDPSNSSITLPAPELSPSPAAPTAPTPPAAAPPPSPAAPVASPDPRSSGPGPYPDSRAPAQPSSRKRAHSGSAGAGPSSRTPFASTSPSPARTYKRDKTAAAAASTASGTPQPRKPKAAAAARAHSGAVRNASDGEWLPGVHGSISCVRLEYRFERVAGGDTRSAAQAEAECAAFLQLLRAQPDGLQAAEVPPFLSPVSSAP